MGDVCVCVCVTRRWVWPWSSEVVGRRRRGGGADGVGARRWRLVLGRGVDGRCGFGLVMVVAVVVALVVARWWLEGDGRGS